MTAADLSSRRGPMPSRAARPAALVVAPPASLASGGCEAGEHRSNRTVVRVSRLDRSEERKNRGGAEMVAHAKWWRASSIDRWRMQHPHPDGTPVARPKSDKRAVRPLPRRMRARAESKSRSRRCRNGSACEMVARLLDRSVALAAPSPGRHAGRAIKERPSRRPTSPADECGRGGEGAET